LFDPYNFQLTQTGNFNIKENIMNTLLLAIALQATPIPLAKQTIAPPPVPQSYLTEKVLKAYCKDPEVRRLMKQAGTLKACNR